MNTLHYIQEAAQDTDASATQKLGDINVYVSIIGNILHHQ